MCFSEHLCSLLPLPKPLSPADHALFLGNPRFQHRLVALRVQPLGSLRTVEQCQRSCVRAAGLASTGASGSAWSQPEVQELGEVPANACCTVRDFTVLIGDCSVADANSTEFDPKTAHPVVSLG